MSIKMLKKNCRQVLRSQKSKLTPIELVFEKAGAINPPPYKYRVNRTEQVVSCILYSTCTSLKNILHIQGSLSDI